MYIAENVDVETQRTPSVGPERVQYSAMTKSMINNNLIYGETASDILLDGKILPASDPLFETRRFIENLCGDSRPTFQTFDDAIKDDGKKRKDPSLSRILQGLNDENLAELKRLNGLQSGIFIMVNEGDGIWRSNNSVRRVRAVFLDLDGASLEAVLESGLQPHMTVESSPGRYHVYWLVDDCSLEQFKQIQRQLALRFNGDQSVTDLCRVMRLPGFVHHKDRNNPFTTRLLAVNDIPHYKVADVLNKLGLNEQVYTLAKPLVAPAELARVEGALQCIDPSLLHYTEWRNVGFALHHEFGSDGLPLFKTWSMRDMSRYDEREIDSFWSLIKDDRGSNITVATIFHMASSDGKKIIPEYIDKLNKEYFVSQESGKTSVYSEEYNDDLQRLILKRMTFPDFRNFHNNNRVQTGVDGIGNPVYGKLGTVWLEHPDRRQYSGIVMAPNRVNPDKYNRWKGFSVKPIRGSWKKMKDHIFTIICSRNQELFDYVMGWLARMVQFPHMVGEVALVLQGGRGTGKGKLGNWICLLFGQHACHVTNGNHVTGDFNSHLQDCVFLFADEAFWAGDKQAENILKSYITEPTIAISQKFMDLRTVKNMLHVLMASNNDWIVPAGVDERRYCVLKVSDERKQDHEYFKAIDEEMENGGLSAMLYDLLDYDLSNFEVRKVPQTKALFEQKIQSLDPFMEWWYNKLEEGNLVRELQCYWGDIPCEMLYDDYISSAGKIGINRKSGGTQFGMSLKRVLPEGWPKKKLQNPKCDLEAFPKYNKMKNNYQFPSLQVCRSHFESLLNVKIDWGTGETPTAQEWDFADGE